MEDLFGHRRRRSNHTHQPLHLQHLQYYRDEEEDLRNMIAVNSYQHSAISPNSVDVYARGRSQSAHPLDSSPVSAPPFLQGGGTSGDHTLAYDTAPGSSAGVKSPSTAARFLSSMKRSLSYGAPSKKREASLAVSNHPSLSHLRNIRLVFVIRHVVSGADCVFAAFCRNGECIRRLRSHFLRPHHLIISQIRKQQDLPLNKLRWACIYRGRRIYPHYLSHKHTATTIPLPHLRSLHIIQRQQK